MGSSAVEQRMRDADKQIASQNGRPQFPQEEVDAEDIAEIVARWTGIPVTRCWRANVSDAPAWMICCPSA